MTIKKYLQDSRQGPSSDAHKTDVRQQRPFGPRRSVFQGSFGEEAFPMCRPSLRLVPVALGPILILKLTCKTRATCSLTLLTVSVRIVAGFRSGLPAYVVVSRLGRDLMNRGSSEHYHRLSWPGPEIKPFEESSSSP